MGASLRSGRSRVARRLTTEASWPPRNPAVRGGIARARRATVPHRPEGHRASWRRCRCLRGGAAGLAVDMHDRNRFGGPIRGPFQLRLVGLRDFHREIRGPRTVHQDHPAYHRHVLRFRLRDACPHPAVPWARSQADRVAEVRLRRERGRGDRGPSATPTSTCERSRRTRPPWSSRSITPRHSVSTRRPHPAHGARRARRRDLPRPGQGADRRLARVEDSRGARGVHHADGLRRPAQPGAHSPGRSRWMVPRAGRNVTIPVPSLICVGTGTRRHRRGP